MRRVALTIAAVATLACSGLTELAPLPGPPPGASGALPAPWSTLNLPLDQGEVIAATPQTLSVTYADGDAREIAGEFAGALSARGWTVRYAGPDGLLYQLTGDGGDITIAASQAGHTVLVAASAGS